MFKNLWKRFRLLLIILIVGVVGITGVLSLGKNAYADESNDNPKVQPGIEVLLDDHLDWLEGKRVGLITNPTGVTSDLESNIDVLYNHPDVNLTALYGPEHGIRADRPAGEHVDSYIDDKTGLPVYSLYGSTWKPTEEMLEDVDVLLFDIQDIDSNVYTYIYTLGFAMEGAVEHDKELIVLDRPNPNGGTRVEGPVRKAETVSFMGRFLLPIRHGMTVGELATMWNQEYSLGANLKVSEMNGWTRDMLFEDTELPWVMPSPNIPTEDTSTLYAGTELLDDTILSEGLGTTRPFELVGAPWIDSEKLADDMNNLDLAGVTFRPAHFTPTSGAYKGQLVAGAQVHLDDPSELDQVELGLNLITVMRDQNPEKFKMDDNYAGLIGDPVAADMLKDGEPVEDIIASWEDELNTWIKDVRNKYLLYSPYPNGGDVYNHEGVLGILPFDVSTSPEGNVTLDVIGYDNKGEKLDIDSSKIKWEVSGDVGYVEDNVFHAKKAGYGEITARYGKYEANREVNVSPTLIDNIRLGVHPGYTRVVFDLNKTINDYTIEEINDSLTVNIPFGEIKGDLDENGGTIDVENSSVISSIDYSVEDGNFIATFNMKKAGVQYKTPAFASKLVIDFDH